jgi:hypothetical protein
MSKVDNETACAEFQRFIDLNCIFVGIETLGKEDKEAFVEAKGRIVSAIERGDLTINDDGEATYTPRRSKDTNDIVFREPTGATLTAMDRKKQGEDVGKMFATMADMTGTNAKTFSAMRMSDLKVCMAVFNLFLG